MTEAKRVTAKLNFSRNVIGLFRQRAADRFRACQAFHKTHSVITAAAAETSKTGMRTISACKGEAFTAPATASRPRKSLADDPRTRTAPAPSTRLATRAALESSKEGEDDF